jgi:hypothetical protein
MLGDESTLRGYEENRRLTRITGLRGNFITCAVHKTKSGDKMKDE